MEDSITKVNHAKKIRFEKSEYYFIGLVAITFLCFWPTNFHGGHLVLCSQL